MSNGKLNGKSMFVDGPYPYAQNLGVGGKMYKDSDGNWYFGSHAAQGYDRYIKLTPLNDEQLNRLKYLGIVK